MVNYVLLVCLVLMTSVNLWGATAGVSKNSPSDNVTFENSSVDESRERKLKVGVSGVLKRVDPGRNDLATPWLTGTWSKNTSGAVTYSGIQKAKQKAKSYQPKFSGRAGPAPGGGGAGKPQDYEWNVDGQYELVEVDISADINDDGKIDQADNELEDAEKPQPEYMRVNDNFSNGKLDKTGTNDDDLQKIAIKFSNGGRKIGTLRLKIKGGGSFAFYKNKTKKNIAKTVYRLEAGDTVPQYIYLLAKTKYRKEKRLTVKLEYSEPGFKTADTLPIIVVNKIGTKHYFQAARDYIIENKAKFFMQDKSYRKGNYIEKVRTIVMREEATTIKSLDVYTTDLARNADPTLNGIRLKGIDKVVNKFGSRANNTEPFQYTVIINGGNSSDRDGRTYMLSKYNGVFVTNGKSAGISTPNIKRNQTGYIGFPGKQNKFDFVQPLRKSTRAIIGTENHIFNGYTNGLDGLDPVFPNPSTGRERNTFGLVGKVNLDNKNYMIISYSLKKSGNGPGARGITKDLFKSSSNKFTGFYMDGASSISLAHENPHNPKKNKLYVAIKGRRHVSGNIYFYINNYLMFKCTEP